MVTAMRDKVLTVILWLATAAALAYVLAGHAWANQFTTRTGYGL
jgi:hypothetical protein